MEKEDAKKRIDELNRLTSYYAEKYYDEDNPEISDYEYDMLLNELKDLEKKYPEFISEDSLTQHVGGTVKEGFSKVNHEVPLQSLQDIFSFDELYAFDKSVRKTLSKGDQDEVKYCIETKIDGLSVSLEYKNGVFYKGATRGNGLVGEDITENLKTIPHVPLKLSKPVDITVRGEVFIGTDDFLNLNYEREKNEEPLFANARNAAAGSLRQLDTSITKSRPLDIFIFNVQKSNDIKFTSHHESLVYMEELGFNVIPYKILVTNIGDAIKEIERIGKNRDGLGFGIDGAVIKVDNLDDRITLGTTEKVPKWAIAYKYPPENKETVVKDIVFQVGRTGVITPLAILEPVEVAGSTISKTTLHNEDFVKSKDIKIGDTVVIQKAGDVIPEILKVEKEKRTGDEIDFSMPKVCPVCGAPAVRLPGESATRCMGALCPEKQLKNIIHFASREAMNIMGLGDSIIEELLNKKLISNIADLYTLTVDDLKGLKKSGDVFANNLYNAINDSKSNDLYRLIDGLGISGVGVKTAKSLAKRFKTMDNLMNATVDDIISIDDMGDTIAKNVYDYFRQDQTKELIEKLKESNLNMNYIEVEGEDDRFFGKVFVVTGTLENYTREEIENLIESFGGKVMSSVSKKTTYVVCGENPGKKIDKAKTLGTKILTENEFIEMVK